MKNLEFTLSENPNDIRWTKIKHDVNGNPRYVCHYLHLCTAQEKSDEFWARHGLNTIQTQYNIAIYRSHKLGGRKFHNRQYGGGIVFSSYNLGELEKDILRVVAEAEQEQSNNALSQPIQR